MRHLIAFLIALLFSMPAFADGGLQQNTLERIKQTRTIRCGYNVYPPYFMKDPNTGVMSGIFYDVMNEIGKNANLKIDWAEEVGFSDIFAGLDANRYDVWCSGLWPNSTRALLGSFTHPVFYSVITAWVRADDSRYTSLDDLRTKKAKLTVIDGAMESLIAGVDFPDLPTLAMPQQTPFGLNYENVLTGKADAVFSESSAVAEFLETHPHALKSLGVLNALRTFPNTLAVKLGDTQTQSFLNAAVDEVVFSGAADKILKKYEKMPHSFLRVARPFEQE